MKYSVDIDEEAPTPGFVLEGRNMTESFDNYDELEVIGNVHDNPDLIEKGENNDND